MGKRGMVFTLFILCVLLLRGGCRSPEWETTVFVPTGSSDTVKPPAAEEVKDRGV